MAGSDDETTPPGWYRQQDDPTTLRWWDGDEWTDETMPAPGADRPRRRAAERPAGRAPAETASDAEAPAADIPISGDDRPQAARTRVERHERIASDEDWAADAWAEGSRSTPAARAPSAPRTPARQPAARPAGPRRPEARPGTERTAPAAPAPEARAPAPRSDPRRVGGSLGAPAGGAPRVDPRRPMDRPRALGPGRPQPTPRSTASRSARPGAPAAGPPRRRPGDPDGRPPRAGARRDERVVERGRTAPPVVRVALRAALIAVLLGVGYLGYVQLRDAEADDARTLSESERPAAKVDPDAPRLDQVVLQLKDLPRGWTAQAVPADPDDICNGRVPLSVIEPIESTKAVFTMGEAGPFITNLVATFADDDEAQAFIDLTARTVDSCRTYEVEGGTSVELGPLEFPNFGDSSFAAEATGTSTSYGDLAGDLIYVRVGRRVTSLETISFGESDPLSPELVEHLTRLVANRME